MSHHDLRAPERGADAELPATRWRGYLDRATRDGLPGTRTAVRNTLTRLFGPPPFDPTRDLGDPGLTGPGSASWRVIAEPAAIAGGLRGLLLQVAHPLAMAGVHDHSRFRSDPLGRLHRTSAYVTATTFGSVPEALEISDRVRRVHPHVRGQAPDGRSYRADDPGLLAWVSIALTSSFLEAHRLWAPRPLGPAEQDRFVAEQSRIAALLDPRVDLAEFTNDVSAQEQLRQGTVPLPLVDEGYLPRTVADLETTLRSFAADLGVNEQGVDALRFLARPPLPASARLGYRSLYAGALGSLRVHERRALRADRGELRAKVSVAQARATLTTLRATTGIAPSVRAARARVAGTPA